MRLLLQRVREGKVTIEGQNVASIGKGLVVLVGLARRIRLICAAASSGIR